MVLKIAAEETATTRSMREAVVIREYDEERDKAAAEELERRCEFGGGPRGKPSLVTDMLGDPISRIRHFKTRLMLVAEYGEEKEIVGIVRACVKNVTKGDSIYVKLAYILGLRVSPTHRRLSIGTELVKEVEKWCKEKGAEYSYIMTDCTNQASINLFTKKCDYSKFRTPTMLVQPVHAHKKPISSNVAIVKISNEAAESIYRRIFAKSEFFPEDISAILCSRLNLGTFVAVPKKSLSTWDPTGPTLPRGSYAMLSVWNTKEVFQLEVRGVSGLTYVCCKGSRVLDTWMPWLRLPSFPDVFRKFGVLFLYGLHMEGKVGPRLMESLCASAYNMARKEGGCGAVVAELAQWDPVRAAIPHWPRLSFPEDLWCIKKLTGKSDWVNSRPPPVIFVDPRDF